MVDRYVDTDVSGGAGDGTSWGDAYATLALWEAGEGASLSDDHTAHCRASSGTADTQTIINGFTTNTYTVFMTNEDGPNGFWDSNDYRIIEPTGYAIRFTGGETYHMKWMQIESQDSYAMGFFYSAGQNNFSFEGCIFKGSSTDSQSLILTNNSAGAAGAVMRIWNCIFFENTGSSAGSLTMNESQMNFYIFNNTFYGSAFGISHIVSEAHYVRNNRIADADAFSGTFTDDDAYNDYNYITENNNNPALGSNGAYNQTFSYENESGDNFAPTVGDPCISAGDDLDGHGVCPVTDDILGATRDADNPTVGAHEYDAATSFEYTGSGTLIFSGDAPIEATYIYGAPSGSIVYSGEAGYEATYNWTGTGTLTFAGAAPSDIILSYIGTGTLNFSGDAPIEVTYIYGETSGTLIFAGTAITTLVHSYTGAGTLVFSGTAPHELVLAAFEYTGSGVITFSGAANVVFDTYSYTGSGTLVFSGTAPASVDSYTYTGAGSIVYSGTAITTPSMNYEGSGTLTFSGAALSDITISYIGIGSIIYSGDAGYEATYNYEGAGTLVFSGAANYEMVVDVYEYTGSGTLVFSGAANYELISHESHGLKPEIVGVERMYQSEVDQ